MVYAKHFVSIFHFAKCETQNVKCKPRLQHLQFGLFAGDEAALDVDGAAGDFDGGLAGLQKGFSSFIPGLKSVNLALGQADHLHPENGFGLHFFAGSFHCGAGVWCSFLY